MDLERLEVGSGLLALATALGSILAATVRSPSFSWATDALSNLGAAGEPTAWLFNGGLIAGGALGLPFAHRLWRRSETRASRLGAAIFAIGFVCLALVGVFPIGTRLHLPAAIAFFLSITYGWFVRGTGVALAGRVRRGIATIWFGVAHVTSWLLWAAGVRIGPGLAVPETVGALLLAAWVHAVAGIDPGVYHYHPGAGELELLREGEFRREAGHLALDQRLAADAGLCIYFLSDVEAVTDRLGDRGYRLPQLEAAVTAGRHYLGAYAHRDLGATGLTFYDDEVTDFLEPRATGQTPMFLWTLGRPA